MKNIFLILVLNLTGIITYKVINNKNNKNNKNTSSLNSQIDFSYNYVTTQYDLSYNSVSTQTDLSNTDMLILLEYKKALENIYDDNEKYEWKFV